LPIFNPGAEVSLIIGLWAGQSAFKAEAKPAADIFKNLIKQVEEIKGRVVFF
jgi:hypothetical protein